MSDFEFIALAITGFLWIIALAYTHMPTKHYDDTPLGKQVNQCIKSRTKQINQIVWKHEEYRHKIDELYFLALDSISKGGLDE